MRATCASYKGRHPLAFEDDDDDDDFPDEEGEEEEESFIAWARRIERRLRQLDAGVRLLQEHTSALKDRAPRGGPKRVEVDSVSRTKPHKTNLLRRLLKD